jgi:hypothetical protein
MDSRRGWLRALATVADHCGQGFHRLIKAGIATMAIMMITAVSVPSPRKLLSQRVDAIISAKKTMSPQIASSQPEINPCPAALAAARPVMGSTPNEIAIREKGPAVTPYFIPILAIEAWWASTQRLRSCECFAALMNPFIRGSKRQARMMSDTK